MANISRYQGEILAHLRDGKHQTAEQIFKHLKKHYFFLTKGGVYKVLQKLASTGLIDKHYHLSDTIIWEIAKEPHAHIYCEQSQEIMDIKTIPIDLDSIVFPVGFKPKSISVTITGTFQDSDCTVTYKE